MADMRVGTPPVAVPTTPTTSSAPAAGSSPLATKWQTAVQNQAATNAKFQQKYAAWAASLNPQEKAALQAYRTPGVYYILNKFLRNGQIPPQKPWQHFTEDGIRNMAYNLNQALKKAPVTDEPITVYRSVVLPTRFQSMGTNLNGQRIDDRAFMSTTVDPIAIKTFEQVRLNKPGKSPVCVAIDVPKGTSMAFIEAALGGGREQEALFPLGEPFGHQLQFSSNVETVDGMPMVSANMLPNASRENWYPAFPAGWKPTGFELKNFFDS
jgi:hypothetical protein